MQKFGLKNPIEDIIMRKDIYIFGNYNSDKVLFEYYKASGIPVIKEKIVLENGISLYQIQKKDTIQ